MSNGFHPAPMSHQRKKRRILWWIIALILAYLVISGKILEFIPK